MKKTISLSTTYADLNDDILAKYKSAALSAHAELFGKTGEGNDYLGWIDYPKVLSDEFLTEIETVATEIRSNADLLLVLGIGGSYIGAKSFIDALSPSFQGEKSKPEIIFLGQSIDGEHLAQVLDYARDKSVYVNVISKSGTTTETAVAFRVVREFMSNKYGEDYLPRLIATTDKSKGALRTYAEQNSLKTFVIPDDVGGRYSVFTPVGLLPIAAAGFDIREIARGYRDAIEHYSLEKGYDNDAVLYATWRNHFLNEGAKTEFMVNYLAKLNPVSEWWKQLFGESEGKDHKGLFPASMSFTTDLHSLGQYVQDGQRVLIESVLNILQENLEISVPKQEDNADQLAYLEGMNYSQISKAAMKATLMAHHEGGVPCLLVNLDSLNSYNLAYLYAFYMVACGISAYMLGVNPFNQPGVELYKKNMFKILGKPGY